MGNVFLLKTAVVETKNNEIDFSNKSGPNEPVI